MRGRKRSKERKPGYLTWKQAFVALGSGFSTHAQKGDEALGRTRPGGTHETLHSFLEQILSEHLLYARPL